MRNAACANASTVDGDQSALSQACAGGHLGVVELLLRHGADPNKKLKVIGYLFAVMLEKVQLFTKDGGTCIMEAAKGGHTNVVHMLLDWPNVSSAIPPPPAPPVTQNAAPVLLPTPAPPSTTRQAAPASTFQPVMQAASVNQQLKSRRSAVLLNVSYVDFFVYFSNQATQKPFHPHPNCCPSLACCPPPPLRPAWSDQAQRPPRWSPLHQRHWRR